MAKVVVQMSETVTNFYYKDALQGTVLRSKLKDQSDRGYLGCVLDTLELVKSSNKPETLYINLDHEFESDLWCMCGKNEDVYYLPDGINLDCSKHHYRCTSCHAIVQIG